MQMSKLVVEFYRHFDAQLAYPNREWKVHGSWVTKQKDMDMVVTVLSGKHRSVVAHPSIHFLGQIT